MNGIRRDELDRGICGCQVRGGIAAMGVRLWGLIHGVWWRFVHVA